jgi:hypothetical protein
MNGGGVAAAQVRLPTHSSAEVSEPQVALGLRGVVAGYGPASRRKESKPQTARCAKSTRWSPPRGLTSSSTSGQRHTGGLGVSTCTRPGRRTAPVRISACWCPTFPICSLCTVLTRSRYREAEEPFEEFFRTIQAKIVGAW